MKKNTIHLIIGSLILLINIPTHGQTLESLWKFEIGSRVLASPVEKDGTVYVGDVEGRFYAVDALSGKEKWKVDTKGNIQAKALIVGDKVFFESANVFYLLEQSNGKAVWKFDTGMKRFSFTNGELKLDYKIDPWDDKRSTATLVEGVIYVGSGNGTLYGLDAKSGKVRLSINSEENSPIRSSPLVSNSRLYFGDWNGVVYCYDLKKSDFVWKKKTYSWKKPYGTYGGVVSEFIAHQGRLYFGARNFMLNILDLNTGEKEWTYTDSGGGWIVGDPVMFKDTLYIGGSDNFSMYAFHPVIGKNFWKQTQDRNIYTKPVLTEDWLIYTAGNAYNLRDIGKLFLLNRKTGDVINSLELPNGVFSSPILVGENIYFGCYDGNLYCVKVKE